MSTLLWIILSTFFVSIISFIGIITLKIKEDLLLFFVSLSAGVLIGAVFLHLIPEALGSFANNNIFVYVLTGFVLFFLVEKLLHWRHCHNGNCHIHTFAYMNLIGDAVHNFIDGLIIAAGFASNFSLGIVATFAVALHEIPQEIGDFGVLIYGGFKKSEALLFNFITALTAVFGGIAGYYLSSYTKDFAMFLLPFAAGGFIYIAATDLIPEIRKETDIKKSLLSILVFMFGILIMHLAKIFI